VAARRIMTPLISPRSNRSRYAAASPPAPSKRSRACDLAAVARRRRPGRRGGTAATGQWTVGGARRAWRVLAPSLMPTSCASGPEGHAPHAPRCSGRRADPRVRCRILTLEAEMTCVVQPYVITPDRKARAGRGGLVTQTGSRGCIGWSGVCSGSGSDNQVIIRRKS
jgi:hypothetical protein